MALPVVRRSRDQSPDAQPASTEAIVAAVTDLYQACYLRPPAVLVARDAAHFGRIASGVVRSARPGLFFLWFHLFLLLLSLGLALGGEALGAFWCITFAVFLLPLMRAMERAERGLDGVLGWALLQASGAVLLGAAVTCLAYLGGSEPWDALMAAGTAMGAAAGIQLAAELLALIQARYGLIAANAAGDRGPSWATIFRGAKPAAAVVLPRLASALGEVDAARPRNLRLVRNGGRHRGPAQLAIQEAIQAELRRARIWTQNVGPVLGRSAGYASDPAGRVGELAAAAVDPATLPRVLQAAVVLDNLAEAVCIFHGVVVVLPLGAPVSFTPAPAPSQGRWRRSRRVPWHDTLQWLGDAPGLVLALDLAPFDAVADQLLAHQVRKLADAAVRTPAIRAMGAGRFAAALRLRPVQEDASGRLYQIGRREDPSVFVAVRDRVLGAGGVPLEHWISVPPYVATAREAVAWSFGMGEAEYQPIQEA
jgi:hypothetical protein